MNTMTVAELINHLRSLPPKALVYLSRDAEGNGFGTLELSSLCFDEDEHFVTLYPITEHLDYEQLG